MTLREYLAQNPYFDQPDATFPTLTLAAEPAATDADCVNKCLVALVAQNNQILSFLNTFKNQNLSALMGNIGGTRRAANAATLLMARKLNGGIESEGLGMIHVAGTLDGGAYVNLFDTQSDIEAGEDGEEPDEPESYKEVIELIGAWCDELGTWFMSAYQQSQVEGASRALVPIPPALPPALIGAIIGLPAAPILIPVTIGIALLSKVAQGWLSYRNVAQFQEFLNAFKKAFISSRAASLNESIPAMINDTLSTLDDKLAVTVNGEEVSLTNLLKQALTVTNPDGTIEQDILERILKALEALQYNNEEIDLCGVRVALRSKLIDGL